MTRAAVPHDARAARRAFALPIVILLTLAGSLVIAVAFQRHTTQQLMVQRQIVEYRRHHDMLGAQAILRVWLSKQRNEDLALKASPDFPAHRFSLPNGVKISVFLSDGQANPKVDLTGVFPEEKKEWFQEVVYRLPENRPDLIRRTGPPEISVNSAPREVLAALRADDASLADLLIAARLKTPLDTTSLRLTLEDAGLGADEVGSVMRLVTFAPSLWKLTVVAEEPDETRVFTGLAELTQQAVPSPPALHEWREQRETPDEQGAGGAGGIPAPRRTSLR